jgi:drug/metabolite transporter (DMT)-like permease
MTLLLLVSFIWAFSFPLIKGNLTGLDPNFVSFARMLLSLAVFAPFVRPAFFPRPTRAALACVGAVQFGLMYVAYIASYQFLPAHMIVLLTTTTPIFVAVFTDLLDRRVRPASLGTAALAVGAGVVIKYPDQPLSANLTGIALIQLSNIAFAIGQIWYRRIAARTPRWNDRRAFALLYMGAVAVTGAFSLATTNYARLSLSPPEWVALAYLGLIASGVCFFFWNKGARSVNESTLAIMNNLKIPLGIVASLILLREPTDLLRLAAGVLLMGAALVITERTGPARR